MKPVTLAQLLDCDIANLVIVTRKDGMPRCESQVREIAITWLKEGHWKYRLDIADEHGDPCMYISERIHEPLTNIPDHSDESFTHTVMRK